MIRVFDLEATVLVVQHLSPVHDPFLVQILRRATRLPVGWAEQGARLDRGRVYVAPPNYHMTIEEEYVRLDGGPEIARRFLLDILDGSV